MSKKLFYMPIIYSGESIELINLPFVIKPLYRRFLVLEYNLLNLAYAA